MEKSLDRRSRLFFCNTVSFRKLLTNPEEYGILILQTEPQ